MTLLDVMAVLLLLLLVADWAATVVMLRLRRAAPSNTALASRTLTAMLISVAATVAGGLSVAHLVGAPLPSAVMTASIVGAFVLMSLPQVHWLWIYWRGTWQ